MASVNLHSTPPQFIIDGKVQPEVIKSIVKNPPPKLISNVNPCDLLPSSSKIIGDEIFDTLLMNYDEIEPIPLDLDTVTRLDLYYKILNQYLKLILTLNLFKLNLVKAKPKIPKPILTIMIFLSNFQTQIP